MKLKNPITVALVLLIALLAVLSYWATSWVTNDSLHQALIKREEEKAHAISLALENLIAAQNTQAQITARLTVHRHSLGRNLSQLSTPDNFSAIREILDGALLDSSVTFLEAIDKHENMAYRTNEKDEPIQVASN